MDYRYIEQLLERYWLAETTLEEERILRAFFAQKEIPTHLLPLRSLFETSAELLQARLSDNFEAQLLASIDEKAKKTPIVVKAIRPTLISRLRPFYNAAAAIALFLFVGGAMQHGFEAQNANNYRIGVIEGETSPLAASDSLRENLKTLRRVGQELPTATAGDTAHNKSSKAVALPSSAK